MENIENPLGTFGRVEADNGVHMRVMFLFIYFSFFFSLYIKSNIGYIIVPCLSDCVTGTRQQARKGLKCWGKVLSL